MCLQNLIKLHILNIHILKFFLFTISVNNTLGIFAQTPNTFTASTYPSTLQTNSSDGLITEEATILSNLLEKAENFELLSKKYNGGAHSLKADVNIKGYKFKHFLRTSEKDYFLYDHYYNVIYLPHEDLFELAQQCKLDMSDERWHL